MNRRLRSLAVTAGILITTSAAAGVSPNGLMPNGLMPNGLMPNGLMPNGLMPNGLMPNGLMPNGLMPNGLMPNGLMPNGLLANGLMPNGLTSYAIAGGICSCTGGTCPSSGTCPTDDSARTFDQWFMSDPPARDNFMKYFARCAYDASMEVTYVDPTGQGWRWAGGIGFAMTSLKAGTAMTDAEAKWISSCLLAFVNTKGTHQYLSLRLAEGNTASAEAAAALAAGPGETATMGRQFGHFLADLAAPAPTKYACVQTNGDPYWAHVENVLGRTCDTTDCTYVDPASQTQHILTAHLGNCRYGSSITWDARGDGGIGGVTYHPIAVWGPDLGECESARARGYDLLGYSTLEIIDVSTCDGVGRWPDGRPWVPWCTADEAHFTTRIVEASQKVECLNQECLGNADYSGPIYGPAVGKLVGLVDGQAIDAIKAVGGDLDQAYTAVVRYTKSRTATADIWTSAQGGGWSRRTSYDAALHGAGPDVWEATGASDPFEWLQVYPVYPVQDRFGNSTPQVSLKIRLAGAPMSESCTGAVLFQGPNEQGTCNDPSLPKTQPPKKETVCPKQYEGAPGCHGALVWTKRQNVEGWYCRGGGEALYACTADDAPELDAVGFIPGKPWCMPGDATSFVGVCR